MRPPKSTAVEAQYGGHRGLRSRRRRRRSKKEKIGRGEEMQIAATSSPFRLSHFSSSYTLFLLFFDFIDLVRFGYTFD
jgi:hypothetical protein